MTWHRQKELNAKPAAWLMALLPVFAALLYAAFDGHQAAGDTNWAQFLVRFAGIALAGLPLATAHLIASHSPGWPASAVWIAAFVVYPLSANAIAPDAFPLAVRDVIVAAAFSGASLMAGGARGRIVSLMHRLPITLDGVVVGLLAIWTLAVTSLFGSTPDAVNNQPLGVLFDARRLIAAPIEFAAYFAQFFIAAVLMFGFYWICRQLLIRRVLQDQGWIAMALASLTIWIVYTPLAGSVVLMLPVNTAHWTLLPSENHNPFDSLNYGFCAVAWTVIMPIALAAERLLAQRQDAQGSHERARAELHMLQQQINPHFLFNSLNTIYALSLKNSTASADAVVKLSDLLRYAVYRGQDDWVGLDGEITYLANYIDLQLLRFGARCKVSCTWPGDASKLTIPPMLLIMLVENAFKHGVEQLDQAVTVTIDLTLSGPRMQFSCTNTPLPGAQDAEPAGLGLTNLRRRLELLFGERFRLASAPHDDCWVAQLECDLRPC